MKNKKMQRGILSLMIAQSLLLGGCGLLPKEKEIKKVVTLEPEQIKKYELAKVTREDVAVTKQLFCTYTQMKEERLSFGYDGATVEFVYVNVGDQVKEGAVLAKLQLGTLEEDIKELEYSIEETEMLKRHTEEQKELALNNLKKKYNSGKIDSETYRVESRKTESEYTIKINEYEDTLTIDNMKLDKYKERLEGSIIYAPMDGMVSYVKSNLEGSWQPSGTGVITVVDSSKCAFRSDTMSEAVYFTAGQKVVLKNNNGMEYKAVLLSEEEAPDTSHLYFELEEMDFEIAVGTKASITIVLEEQKNVLALPRLAVHYAGNQYYVFVEDENGLRMTRDITVGLQGNTLYEITSGLSEGDIVIRR